jgi:SlyX protein
MDDRIVELETRLTFQEEHLEGLSRTVGRQQLVIDDLRRELDELHQRLKLIANGSMERHGEEIPPHY